MESIEENTPETPDTPDCVDSVVASYLIATPTQSKIIYDDSVVLHVDPSKISAASYVEFYQSNENFGYSVSADKQTMTSKAGFFDKIIAFFKKLFGLTNVISRNVNQHYNNKQSVIGIVC